LNSSENCINLVGEQAEAFDQHMDADRDWFESSFDAFYFRPEIDGEFDGYVIAGATPPFVHALVKTPEGNQTLPLGWVCVVDIGRYTEKCKEPTGTRYRIRTSPPINNEIREMLLTGVRQYVDHSIASIKKQAPSTRGKGFS
jgi:hypothetical protein